MFTSRYMAGDYSDLETGNIKHLVIVIGNYIADKILNTSLFGSNKMRNSLFITDCSAMTTSSPQLLLPDHVLRTQVCDTCNGQLSVGPIGITQEHGTICGYCSSNLIFVPSLYNKVAKYCLFKCNNRYLGCLKLFYFNEHLNHSCDYKNTTINCIICYCNLHNYSHLITHYQLAHSQYIYFNNNNISIDLSKGGFVLVVIEDKIVKLIWEINYHNLIIETQGEPRSSLMKGITHFQISFIKPNSKCKVFSRITHLSNRICISLKQFRDFGQTLLCNVDFFVQIGEEYLPFKKQIQNNML